MKLFGFETYIRLLPSPSSITRILHRHGLICPLESKKRVAWKSFQHDQPNDLWQIDFKGDFEMTCGKRCYPLTILDDHSRYSLGIIACGNQKGVTVKAHFRSVFQTYGIPRAIYVDNGNPWGNTNGRTRHSQLSAWLMRQDIKVIHGQPYHPQGRGKIERFHRTLKLEVLQDRVLSDLASAQSAFDPWRSIYNHERPHEALELAVPATRYQVSQRTFQEAKGKFSEAFIDQKIGLGETKTDGVWDIYYCRFRIAQLDQKTDVINYDRRLAEPRSARFGQAAEAGKPAYD